MMSLLLPLAVLCPLAASIIVFLSAGRLSARAVGGVACGGVGLAALSAIMLATGLLAGPPGGVVHAQLWEWVRVSGFSADIVFTLDRISMVMILVVTVVGLLIHVYAARYMADDPGIARFFGCMTLFVAAMLVLVLASDLLCLFIGWEGVGLCSYLLIGFWHDDPANTAAARKAFFMTRIGDTALLCGLLLLATQAGSLRIEPILAATMAGLVPSFTLIAAASFVLVGALAKSAQIPFQTWLPDAMAGPTPTSALIHAATMVTAGIYLIARLHVLFAAAPVVMAVMAVTGALTLLVAACTALVQSDLKRILAWSTISQLGYMFLALGCGAWQAALFHLMTHACFKALLFLAAGAIIMRLGHEQDIFRMGGLRRTMPGLGVAFVAGASALAGLPVVTAGFYSKEMILAGVWGSRFMTPLSAHVLWATGLLGAFLTALYIFRCVFIVFAGEGKGAVSGGTPRLMAVPLACLTFLALFGGIIEMPDVIAPVHLFTALLSPSGHPSPMHEPGWTVLAGAIVPLAGLAVAWVLWGRTPAVMREMPQQAAIIRLARPGHGMDVLYDHIFVQPLRLLVWLTRRDVPDRLVAQAGWLTRSASIALAKTRKDILDTVARRTAIMTAEGSLLLGWMQNGRVRWYAGWVAGGLCVALAVVMLS
ncbi:NADH-quinone oxidoreductase subunit L [Komagataeibacter melaceti]|uniref:NADH-quinone oxidoreductase subunit L n=1 Tax=Komagataeibacter melaceti TaxID=2766577 RepID=A0A371Z4B0_9PROT|nr:NADH-quinone oxidoreductase subunit L [Komagataeibacter melaceti]RFD21315.1 NADH-quinone oxidoreductase subunit L [Komagataeibacter melaceti]